ncbi:MAG: hypothetical protein HY201_05705, partial [Nitrospirae bacterium]|nr:hypothetical protein [Candidatus Troglogloeales bacterium]
IFFAWGFRLYILTVRWGTDPFRAWTIFFALIFVLIGLFLIWFGKAGSMAKKKNYTQLSYASLFMILFWTHRLANLVLYPDIDPNPRAHLHLSVIFIVIGAFLLAVGRNGLKQDTPEQR